MKRMHALLTGLLLLAAGTLHSKGAVTITAMEIGGDVIFSASGTIDLTDLGFVGTSTGLSGINPSGGNWKIGAPATVTSSDNYASIAGPSSFGSGGFAGIPDIALGDKFGVLPVANRLDVPPGYVSGSPLAASMTYSGETFASLGITPGTYTWSWGFGANADSVTLNIVPEPARALLYLLGVGAVLARRRR